MVGRTYELGRHAGGQVRRIEERGDPATAVLHLGGANDVLGFLEFGGETVRVPAERLLWGPRRSIGSLLVALPSEASAPQDLLQELAAGD